MDSLHTISQRRTDIKQKAGTMFRLNDYYKNLLFCDFLEHREFRRIVNGAGGGGRTHTVSLPRDFEFYKQINIYIQNQSGSHFRFFYLLQQRSV